MSDTAVPSQKEVEYIDALSRPQVVEAYSRWSNFSNGEKRCFSLLGKSPCSVLDIGCGAGRFLYWKDVLVNRYVGIDASLRMIESARAAFPGKDFRHGDIMEQEFSDGEFDLILLLHNVLDMLHPKVRRSDLLNRVGRYLKNDGSVIVSSHLIHSKDESSRYFEEDYHGAKVYCYRSHLSDFCKELELEDLLVDMAVRDYRSEHADWAYIVARKK